MMISNIIIVFWSLILLLILILVVKAWKNEKKKQKWVEHVQIGNKCYYHFVSGTQGQDMWISKKRPDGKYEITFVGQERFMYPKKENHGDRGKHLNKE